MPDLKLLPAAAVRIFVESLPERLNREAWFKTRQILKIALTRVNPNLPFSGDSTQPSV